jgi:glycine cleavage system H lipoate-binding protein
LGSGWLYKMRVLKPEELKSLMSEEDYNKLIGAKS